MELRWMCYHGHAPLSTGAGVINQGQSPQGSAMVLQYRDGVTHDAPWLNVPIVFYDAKSPA